MRAGDNSAVEAARSDDEPLDKAEGEGADEEPADTIEPEPEPDAVGLPCPIKALLAARCQGCHGADARNGTPLLTRDNLLAVSIKDASLKVVERALLRATATEKPMPPVGKGERLTEPELALIRDWLEQGAQAGRCDE